MRARGYPSDFDGLPTVASETDPDAPVIAVNDYRTDARAGFQHATAARRAKPMTSRTLSFFRNGTWRPQGGLTRSRCARRTWCILLLAFSLRVHAHVPACDTVKYDLRTLDSAIEQYVAEHGELPGPGAWTNELIRDGLVSRDTHAADPWGFAYRYEVHANRKFELYSIGADGIAGTGDDQRKADAWRWARCTEPNRTWSWLGCS
jgi:hypothetical protein